jgi:hypothetical protein
MAWREEEKCRASPSAARIVAAARRRLRVERVERVERVDHRKRDGDLLTGARRKRPALRPRSVLARQIEAVDHLYSVRMVVSACARFRVGEIPWLARRP